MGWKNLGRKWIKIADNDRYITKEWQISVDIEPILPSGSSLLPDIANLIPLNDSVSIVYNPVKKANQLSRSNPSIEWLHENLSYYHYPVTQKEYSLHPTRYKMLYINLQNLSEIGQSRNEGTLHSVLGIVYAHNVGEQS